jgi:hypothetical protein
MPFVKGNKFVWALGNPLMANRIANFIADEPRTIDTNYCGPCCDPTQVGFTHAKAMVLCCMDFRLRDNMACHLDLKGYKNDYDQVIAAGASLGYNGLSTYEGWNTFIDEHITLAYDLHDISQIIIVEHEKCGAYEVQYGELTTEQELERHIENVTTCGNTLWEKYNPETGTVMRIPNLSIIGYVISIDASEFTEIYRKTQ